MSVSSNNSLLTSGMESDTGPGVHPVTIGGEEVDVKVSSVDDAFDDNEFLVTERDGVLLHFKDGARQEVKGVPDVWAEGQGGLLDFVLAQDFQQSREVFLTYAEATWIGARTALARAELSADGSTLVNFERLFVQPKSSRGGRHFGSRVVEATNGELFVTIGDRGDKSCHKAIASTCWFHCVNGIDTRPNFFTIRKSDRALMAHFIHHKRCGAFRQCFGFG